MGHGFAIGLLLVGAAQVPAAETIARQLESSDARTVAWGAYNAGAYHRDDMIPRLQRILESPPATGRSEEYAFIGVVMDSLVQLNARVPARLLLPYVDKQPVHTFVLLSSTTNRKGVLLEMLPRLSGFQWFAASNMLFEDRSPGLVAYLLETVRLELRIIVTDTGNEGFGTASADGGIAVGDGIGQNPKGYPPHAEYRFELEPRRGFAVLENGPRPVYYSRTVTSSSQYAGSDLRIAGPDHEDRLQYLRAMSPETEGMPFRAETIATVRWSTAAALLQSVRELRSQVEQRFRSLVNRARQSRRAPMDLGVPPLRIDVHLVDRRINKATPLPKISQ
jgi:hypothetical protein